MTDITIGPTKHSIGEYDLILNVIRFWNWTDQETVDFYRYPRTETNFEMIIRVVCHEEMHVVLHKFIRGYATYQYDEITRCRMGDLV